MGLSPVIIVLTYFGSKLNKIYEVKNFNFLDVISTDFILFTLILVILIMIRIIFKIKKKSKQKMWNCKNTTSIICITILSTIGYQDR